MIESQNKVKIYEENGRDAVPDGAGDQPSICVKSHWNQETMVVLMVAGVNYTVAAGDLMAAIKNATNTARWGWPC